MTDLSRNELEDLQADIQVYKKMDCSADEVQFWVDVETVTESNLKIIKEEERKSRRYDKRDGINKQVKQDIHKIFSGKSLAKLNTLQEQVIKKISAGASAGIDVAYWESLL